LFIGCLAHDEEKKEVEERRVAVKKEKGTAQCEKGHLLHYVLLAAYSYMQCSSEGGGEARALKSLTYFGNCLIGRKRSAIPTARKKNH
jgi:hypothetical protein